MTVTWVDKETLDRLIVDRIKKVDVILDLGCGIRPQTFFRPRLHICCDPHPEYVQILRDYYTQNSGVMVLQGRAEEILRLMPDNSVDSVFLIDVIEHMEKEEGGRVLNDCSRIARKQVIVFTPLGLMLQEYSADATDGWGLRGGDWQTHRSGWTPDDFDGTWEILACEAYHTVSADQKVLDRPFGAFWALLNVASPKFVRLPLKLAIISHNLPPAPYGQSNVLYRLLEAIHPNDYCLLSRENYDAFEYLVNRSSRLIPSSSPRLGGKYYHLGGEKVLKRPSRMGLGVIRDACNIILRTLQRTRRILRIVNEEKAGAVISCSGDLHDLPSAWLAARLKGVPFFAYIFDYYAYQWVGRLQRFFARCVEPLVLKGAKTVIVPNEFLREEYSRRYGISAVVIHNPSRIGHNSAEHEIPWPATAEEIAILYTGAVYHAHYDAFHNLLKAFEQLNRSELKLHIYTAQTVADLDRAGIKGPVVHHPHIAPIKVPDLQRKADILFLPLAFRSAIPEVIKTSAPGKMGEYLASGRPILVHAPRDSFVSWYFATYRCGYVVDEDDPCALAQGVRDIIDNSQLRREMTANATRRLQADFQPEAARDRFLQVLSDSITGG